MEFVSSFVLLKSNNNISWSSLRNTSKTYIDKISLSLTESGKGYFYWGNNPLSKYGFSMPVITVNEDTIVCFTSHLTHAVRLKEYLYEAHEIELSICRVPFDYSVKFSESDISNLKLDSELGISFLLETLEVNWKLIVNIYTTGITTFSMTDSEKIIKRIIQLSEKVCINVQ